MIIQGLFYEKIAFILGSANTLLLIHIYLFNTFTWDTTSKDARSKIAPVSKFY